MGMKLNKLGYNIDFESIIKTIKNPGRPHVQNALIKAGYFKKVDDVFDQVLGFNKATYINKNKPLANMLINRMRELGGISIIAYPRIYSNLSKTENISQLDLDGLEGFHPSHSKREIQYYLNYASKNNLLVTGGSDYHGWDDKSSAGSFDIDENYLNNFTKLLN